MLESAVIVIGLFVGFVMTVLGVAGYVVNLATKCKHYCRFRAERGSCPVTYGYVCQDCGVFLSSKERDDMVYGDI